VKVLYIGGTGEISQACVERSVEIGHDVTVFNRGQKDEKTPPSVTHIVGDVHDEETYGGLAEGHFDVICQFLAFGPTAVQRDIDLYSGRCGQYVFVSTASAYRKSPVGSVITESTPLENPFWEYSRRKAECEALLARSADRLASTIVRPSHTYRTRLPSTVIDGNHLAWRLVRDKPVVVHDDGESIWTVTHADDFARAFTALVGRAECVGNAYNITDDVAYSWNDILRAVGEALEKPPTIHPVPAETLVRRLPELAGPLLGDKANSMRFDNAKIRSAIGPWKCEVSLTEGVASAATFVRSRLEAGYRPDPAVDALIDRMVADHPL